MIQYEQQAAMLFKCQINYLYHKPPCSGPMPEYNPYPYPAYKWAKPNKDYLMDANVVQSGLALSIGVTAYYFVRTCLRIAVPASNLVPAP